MLNCSKMFFANEKPFCDYFSKGRGMCRFYRIYTNAYYNQLSGVVVVDLKYYRDAKLFAIEVRDERQLLWNIFKNAVLYQIRLNSAFNLKFVLDEAEC